ncbi:MAG TPA: integrase arm-type DNA-binding domain-containing protein [Usitatibacter sp.]|jgi:integrase|nr:integrase arm-type DNA-binding domain-containing protein [Usitatibacter sp.]
MKVELLEAAMDGVPEKVAGGIAQAPQEGARTAGSHKLTQRAIDSFLARHRAGKVTRHAKLGDGGGMYLTVTQAGLPVWRVKYRYGGTEKTYSIGPYGATAPSITLAAARAERDRIRNYLRKGIDPTQERQVERASNIKASAHTFEAVAKDWLKQRRKAWSAVHYDKSLRAFERDVFPVIGGLPIRQIESVTISGIVETIANRGALDTSSKILQHINGVFRFARAKGLCSYQENPADAAREILPKRQKQRRRPALLKWTELGAVLRAAETARLSPAVRMAHRLCAFTGLRIGNVVDAEWREFDLDADHPLWLIPRTKMKAKDREHDHKVLLGPTISADLREWRSLTKGKGYVFPSPAGGAHITRESLEKAYRTTLGLRDEHTPHGWRAAFSTLARDEGGFDRDVVELALDHIHDNDVVRAYDRGERLQQRIKLMNWWDAQLAHAQRGAEILPMSKKA